MGPSGSASFPELAQANPRADVITQEQRLWVADPKAVHHILQGSCDLYEKPSVIKEIVAAVIGRGVGGVEGKSFLACLPRVITKTGLGDEHKRQRRAVSPAFGSETKALYPYFSRCSNAVGHVSTALDR